MLLLGACFVAPELQVFTETGEVRRSYYRLRGLSRENRKRMGDERRAFQYLETGSGSGVCTRKSHQDARCRFLKKWRARGDSNSRPSA